MRIQTLLLETTKVAPSAATQRPEPPSLRRTSRFAMHIPDDARERVGHVGGGDVCVSRGGREKGEGRISDFARLSRNPIPPQYNAPPERS